MAGVAATALLVRGSNEPTEFSNELDAVRHHDQFWRERGVRSAYFLALADLFDQRRDVGNLPSLSYLAVAEMTDDRLIHAEAAARPMDATEFADEGSRHLDTGHLRVASDDDFQNLVPKIRHGGDGIEPGLLLGVPVVCRQPARGVDHGVEVHQVVENIDVAFVASRKPALDHGSRSAHSDSMTATLHLRLASIGVWRTAP